MTIIPLHPSGNIAGFRKAEFRKLATLFSRGAAVKALYDMAVDVDFDEGVSRITYTRTAGHRPHLQFLIRHVGPQTAHYEVWCEGRGRVIRSGLFDRAYERLEAEVEALIADAD